MGRWRLENRGAGIGIILEGPYKIKLQYAVKLTFHATNNVVKYEALLMALRVPREVNATHVTIHSDSQLVVNQFQGKFQVKDQNLAKYDTRIKEFIAGIHLAGEEVIMLQIP
ncbi:hypothetical protein P3X46_032537 [Hevea brasiliensis]|uniref:RNase H type-1 domain-containing protein n=1 Tax=Hevea brasiliensis TaxID=3981 RepID=A0ABQ9KDK9_HEVBR|nr:hypothetical protein P3X46_032537 [Hevea brasiliensis]